MPKSRTRKNRKPAFRCQKTKEPKTLTKTDSFGNVHVVDNPDAGKNRFINHRNTK